MQRFLAAALCGFVLVLAGCNSDGARVKVKGKVYLDGNLVEKGHVEFEAVDKKSPSSKGGEIDNGAFTADVPAGEMIVRIYAPKVVGTVPLMKEDPKSPKRDIVKEQAPEKYNVKSDLRATIKAGMEELEFKLVTK